MSPQNHWMMKIFKKFEHNIRKIERKITIISSHCSEIFNLSTKIIDLTKLKGLDLKSFYKNL